MRGTVMLRSFFVFVILLSLGMAAVVMGVCVPTVYTVTSSAPPPSFNWTDTSGPWTPAGGFPGCAPGDTAADTNLSPSTIVVNSAIPNPIIGLNLNCSGCVIDVQPGGSLTLAGAGTVGNGATLAVNGGTVTIANAGDLTFNSGSALQVNSGTVDVQTGGQITAGGTSTITSGTMQVSGGTVNLPAAASLDVQSGAQLLLTSGSVTGSGSVDNAGSLQANGSGTFTVSAALNNLSTGSVSVNGGTLSLEGGGSGDAPFAIAAGATLDFPLNTYTMTPNGVVSGDGTLSISGGTLSIGGVTSPGAFALSSGTLTGSGFLSVTSSMDWSGGTITGSGGAELAGGANATLSGANGPMILDGRTFNVYGFASYTANTNFLELANTATLAVYGTFDFTDDGSILSSGSPLLAIDPNGFLYKSGGSGTSTIQAPTTNDATVNAFSGVLELAGDGSHNGSFYASSGATIAFSASSTTLTGSSSIFSDGTIHFASGLTSMNGYYSVNGTTLIDGSAVLTFTGSNGTTNGFVLDDGTLDLGSDFHVVDDGTWSGGTINGTGGGTFHVDSGATLTIDAATGTAVINGGTLANHGTIDYTADASGSNDLELDNGAVIQNDGTFDIRTDAPIVVGGILVENRAVSTLASPVHPQLVAGSPAFDNSASGTLQKSAGTGSTTFEPVLNNDGAVLAQSGTISFTDQYLQTGGTTSLAGGDLELTAFPLTLSGGVLDGTGTITGDVQNDANVAPGGSSSIGTIDVSGNYTQGSGGTFSVELDTAATDALNAGAAATLDGTLDVSFLPSAAPANGTTWDPLTFASRTGDFALKNLPSDPVTVTSSYTPTALQLTATIITDLSIAVNGPATVDAAAALSYTVDVTNGGSNATSGTTTVANTLPAGVTGASGSGTGWSCGAPSGGVITCTTTANIASGGGYPALTFAMTAPPDGGSISDSATVSSANDPNGANDSDSASTTVTPLADVSVTKSGPAGVTSGQNVVYTIVVTNDGPSQATGVVVSDPTPANLTFVSNSGACTTPFPCSLGTLTSGQSMTITSTFSTSPSFSGNVTNTATVTGTTTDPDSSDDSASATTNVGAQADLAIGKSGPASAVAGSNVVYTIIVTNNGPSPAASVVVSDPTPAGIAFLSNSGACATAFPCSLGTLTSGQSATITSTYTIPPGYSGASVTNTATASSSTNDPSSGDNTSMATTTVVQSADLSITKSGPASAIAGSSVSYTIVVENDGPNAAAGVQVSDPTPAGLTFVSNSGDCTTAFPCSLGTLSDGASATITSTYAIPPGYSGASVTNTASVSSSTSDPSSGNDTSTVTTTVVPSADLSITKSGPASATRDSNVSYTIVVTNEGPGTAGGVQVSDATPAGLTFVSNSGDCTTAFPCSIGVLTSGQTATITSTFFVPSGYAPATISNTASVGSSSNDPNATNDSDTAITPIATTGSADLRVTKSGPSHGDVGDLVTFTISVRNAGPDAATSVAIADPTPRGLQFVSNSGDCTTSFPCTIASLAAGQQASISATYEVVESRERITNRATVSSAASDPNPGNNDDTAVIGTITCPTTAPQLLAPADGTTVTGDVAFSWTAVPNATSYVLTVDGDGDPITVTTSHTSASVELGGGTYQWTVAAQGDGACTPIVSQSFSFTDCENPPAPLASVIGETTTGQTFTVQWDDTGAASYELQESRDESFAQPTSLDVDGTSRTITKRVDAATPFFYRVRSISACGARGEVFSPVVRVVVVPVPTPDDPAPSVNVPLGSTTPVTFRIFVPGLPDATTPFVATVDQPWLAVVPTSGVVPPEGVFLTISIDPSGLPNGTWTGTLLIVYGSAGVHSRIETNGTTTVSIPISVSLVTPVTPRTVATPAESALVVPTLGHLAGIDSAWRSDLRIANLGAIAQTYRLSFTSDANGANPVKSTNITIGSGVTTAFDDIVHTLFGIGSAGDAANGSLVIEPLDAQGKVIPDAAASKVSVVSSRTYNASANGTLGQFIPAIPFPNFLRAHTGTVLSLQQIAETNEFRTNLGLVEAAGKAMTANVRVLDATGATLLSLPIALHAGQQLQLNSFLAQHSIVLPNGRIEVEATGGDGRITAYASVVDGQSTDPLLVSAVPLTGIGATRFVVPGIADLDAFAASWRSDLRVFNAGSTPQSATFTFFPIGDAASSTSREAVIDPGQVVAFDDILSSLFGITNAGGALHVIVPSAAPLVVTGRTYDVTPHGTLGQFIPAVTEAEAVGANERSLQLVQTESSVRYRTNVGLVEVSGQPVTAEISVHLPDSKVTPTVLLPLGAFESRQFPLLDNLGIGAVYNARISIRVVDGTGRLTAYASVVDNETQDATYVPAQ